MIRVVDAIELLDIDIKDLFTFEAPAEARAAHAEVRSIWAQAVHARSTEGYLAAARACDAAAVAFAIAGQKEQQIRMLMGAGICLVRASSEGRADMLGKATAYQEEALRLAHDAGLSHLEASAQVEVVSCFAITVSLCARGRDPNSQRATDRLLAQLEADAACAKDRLLALGDKEGAATVQAGVAVALFHASANGSAGQRERAWREATKAVIEFEDAGIDGVRLGYLLSTTCLAIHQRAAETRDAELLHQAIEAGVAAVTKFRGAPGQELPMAMAALGLGSLWSEHAEWSGEPLGWRHAGRWFREAVELLGHLNRTDDCELALKSERIALVKWLARTPGFDSVDAAVLDTKEDAEPNGDTSSAAEWEAALAQQQELLLREKESNEQEAGIADGPAPASTPSVGDDFAGAVRMLKSRVVRDATNAEIEEVHALLVRARDGIPADQRVEAVTNLRVMLDALRLDLVDATDGKSLTLTMKSGLVRLERGKKSWALPDVEVELRRKEPPTFSPRPSRAKSETDVNHSLE